MFARWLAAALSVLAGAPSAEAHGIAGFGPRTLSTTASHSPGRRSFWACKTARSRSNWRHDHPRYAGACTRSNSAEAPASADCGGQALAALMRPRRSGSRVSAEKISVRVALGGRFHVVGHVGAGDLAQLVDHPIGGQLGALGALRPGLLDRFGDIRFSYILVPDQSRRLAAVAGPDGGLRGVRVDQVLRDEPSTSQPGAPATDNQHYRGPAAKAPDVRPKNADPRAEGRFHARSQGARPVSELQIEVLKADTRENAAAGSAAGA